MKDHFLNATPTIKKLHEIQKCRRDGDGSSIKNPDRDSAPGESAQSLKKAVQNNGRNIKTKTEEIPLDRLVSGLGTWIDLVCRCRFYSKTSTPGN